MPKLILMPKLDQQSCKRMAHCEVCKRILPNIPTNGTVRIAICQDGREKCWQSPVQNESEYLMDLFQKPEYLHRPDVTVETFLFTFFPNHEATMQQTLFQLGQMDIFFMTGFRSANNNTMSENLNYNSTKRTIWYY